MKEEGENMYVIFLMISIIVLVLTIKPKKKLKRRKDKGLLESLNNKLSKLYYKKESRKYYKLKQKIVKAGLTMSPETYQTVRLILPVVIMVIYIFFKMINFINLKISAENLTEAAKILNDESILNIRLNINFLTVLIIGLIALFLQRVVLFIMGKIRAEISKKEALILQTYAIMLLKTTKPVKQILISLYERANHFKPHLKQANERFSTNPDAALSELKESAQGDFINICIALQQALNGDRKLSVTYLENRRNLSREVNKQIRIRNQTRDQGIGILIMMIPLVVSLAIVGYPWIMYTLKAIKSIPI